MSADKRWRLVCYDVRDPKRYRRVRKVLRAHGHAVQYSVFRCRLDDREVARLRWELSKVMAPEDALLVVDLCPSCARRVISRNQVDDWTDEDVTYRILPERSASAPASSDQASPAVGAPAGPRSRNPRK